MRAAPLLLPALAALAQMALTSCSDAPPDPAPLPSRPTIVSLNPCADAILAEVADRAQLLAISHYSHDPAASSMDMALARSLPATRGTVEEVAALAPDLVVAGGFIDPATRAAYARLGIVVEVVGIATTIADSEAQVTRLALLAGHPQRGAALNARIGAALAAARPDPGAAPVTAVLWQSGAMVAGEQSLVADLLARTGFANHATARGFGQADRIGLEQMLADPPQVLLLASEGGAQDRALSHPVLARLDGTRREAFDPRLIYCGGPTIPRAAARLAAIRRAAQGGRGA